MTRFDPFRDMERLFAETFRTPASGAMPMDVYHDGENFVVQIDLPGVDPSSIDVDVDDQTLTIRAARPAASGDGIKWLTRERPAGAFARQLTLGRGLATDRIRADYADGVLRLTLPVAEEAKPRKIAVQHTAQPLSIEHTENAEPAGSTGESVTVPDDARELTHSAV